MSDSRCVMLVLYESQPELLEAARAAVSDSELMEIRAGGWEEMRTATDLDGVLSGHIHRNGFYRLLERSDEAAAANVEWTRTIVTPIDIRILARWLVAPPLLQRREQLADPEVRHRTRWSIILRDVSVLHTNGKAATSLRLGLPPEWAHGLAPMDAATAPERMQARLTLLRDCVGQFCREARPGALPDAPR